MEQESDSPPSQLPGIGNSPRILEDFKQILKPKFREIERHIEDVERTKPLVEAFFGKKMVLEFLSSNKFFEFKHTLGAVPSDVIVGAPVDNFNARISSSTSFPWTTTSIFLRTSHAPVIVTVYLVA